MHMKKGTQFLKTNGLHFIGFPVILFYLEIVLLCSTMGAVQESYIWYIGLFSLGYGWFLSFLTTLTKSKRGNSIIGGSLLALLGLLFCILYFLFCEFRMFYDLNTMLSGATDAIGGFSSDIISMLFRFDGICHVLLFFLPLILYCFLLKKGVYPTYTTFKKKLCLVGGGLMIWFVALSSIYFVDADALTYDYNYSFNTAIEKFGLLTSLRLEVKHIVNSDEEQVSFAYVSLDEEEERKEQETEEDAAGIETSGNKDTKPGKEAESVSQNDASTNEVADEKTKGKNELDIDFKKLMEQDNGAFAALDEYVSSLQASSKNAYTGMFEGKNLIFLTAEAFTAEAIDPNRTPTLYRLAHKGIRFQDFYQPSSAGTTGGEYCNLFGMIPASGGSSMKKMASHYNWTTLASRLSEMGYYGKAYHNNDYTYYDRDKTHITLGFSDGYEGRGNGLEKMLTKQWPESDLEMIKGTLSNYVKKQPFHIYYMTVSGHSLYTFGQNAMSQKHKEQVENLPYSEPVKAYLACQIELEDALSYLVGQLERLHMADDTVIVISADHFPYGLDQDSGQFTYLQELYGHKIQDNLDRDHNRLIIWSGCLEKEAPILVEDPVSSLDILPTLCNLFGVRFDSRLLPGRDVFSDATPLVFNGGYDFKTDKGTYIASRGKFIPKKSGDSVDAEYVEKMKLIVKNKISYCKGVLAQDYFRHVFSEELETEK